MLHYTYNRLDDLKSRRDRCDCAPTEEDAKRCFILPFDRMVSPGAASCASDILPGLRVMCLMPAWEVIHAALAGRNASQALGVCPADIAFLPFLRRLSWLRH